MNPELHSLASDHMPWFVTAPGQSDVLYVGTVTFLTVMIILIGTFYFRLHALPEQMAHKSKKLQFDLVAVLGLISLFTHNHLFWIAGLLLALVPLPDFATPINSMAGSLERMSRPKKAQPNQVHGGNEAADAGEETEFPTIDPAGDTKDGTHV